MDRVTPACPDVVGGLPRCSRWPAPMQSVACPDAVGGRAPDAICPLLSHSLIPNIPVLCLTLIFLKSPLAI